MALRSKRTRLEAPKRGIIFDFDGTIADSLPAIIGVAEDLMHRPTPYTAQEIDAMRDLSIPDLLKALGIPRWKAVILLFRGRRMLKQHMHGIPVHKGMREVIESLHAQGVPLYVLSSNSTENVQKYLQWHQLSHYFQNVYGGVSMLGKAPRLLQLLETEGLETVGTWYVGDEMRDVSAARSVGLHIATVTWGYNTSAALKNKQPDAVVDTAEQLSKVLKAAWKK